MSTNTVAQSEKVAATKTLQNEYIAQWLELSDFLNLDECQIYEQFLVWEPEVGGSIDRISTMVGESFKEFAIRDMDKLDTLREDMIKEAGYLAEEIGLRNNAEVLSEILYTYGNLFIEKSEDLTLDILPNRYVTLVDDEQRIVSAVRGEFPENIIMKANKLVLYEGRYGQRIINKDKFIHIKYKDTPIFWNDSRGRQTFGVYSASPLHRVIMPIWRKRMTNLADVMWRFKNVPREHHQVSSEMFSLDKYIGDNNTKRAAANAEAVAFLTSYSAGLKNQVSDQGYATLDTVKIEMIESHNQYMQTNELIDQINQEIWTAMNMPKSMITGESTSSYASELVIANYVSQKIVQISSKIKPVILSNIRQRLKLINSAFPVDELDIKIEMNMAATKLETLRQMAIMGQLKVFTDDEIRDEDGYKPLTDTQKAELKEKAKQEVDMKQTALPSGNRVDGTKGAKPPQTPQSDVQHSNDQSTKNTRTDK
jgi:hypothetical protein